MFPTQPWFHTPLLALLLTCLPSSGALADDTSESRNPVAISLRNNGLPASDLVMAEPEGPRVLSPEAAWELKKAGTDLSKLEPDPTTDLWKGNTPSDVAGKDDLLPIHPGEVVSYQGTIASSSGRFRFNVRIRSADGSQQTMTLMLSTGLHTFLLRKELLRKLGYQIPAMKHLDRVKVRFPDAFTRDFVLSTEIPTATYGAAARWVPTSEPGADPLEVSFQDVVAMDATPLYYNVALGPPIELIPGTHQVRAAGPRILRALALPYALVNVPESINQFDWTVGSIQNEAVRFDLADDANFACTLDDALWMLRKIAALSRQDVEQIVFAARYPEAISRILVEKILSRRNALVSAFGLRQHYPDLAFDPWLSQEPAVKSGKVLQQEWPGYASRFAYGDPASPLQDFHNYLLAQIQGNLIDNLVTLANRALPAWTATSQTNSHNQELMQQALGQYVQTGAIQQVRFGFWAAPLAGGGFDLSRDVVIGAYLGTNNLVQLADTFGVRLSAGFIVGADGLPTGTPLTARLQGTVEGTVSLSLTHLKPLTSLKQALTEPIQNGIVPWVFYRASDVFRRLADAKPGETSQSPEELKKALAAELEQLRDFMGVGESLILVQSLGASESISAGVQLPVPLVAPSLSLRPNASQMVLSRLHFFRKDSNTIIVYKDGGESGGGGLALEFTTGLNVKYPVFSVSGKRSDGKAESRIFRVNVDPDPASNPDLYASASALTAALRTGSVEALTSRQKPTRVGVEFKDQTDHAQFFGFVNRRMATNAKIAIELPDEPVESFIVLSDGNQSGGSFQALGTQIASYFLKWGSGNSSLGVDTKGFQNPGQSFLGYSQTRNAQIQARADRWLTDASVKVQYRWEGWSVSAAELTRLVKSLSDRLGFELYPEGFMNDTSEIQLYELGLSVSLYEKAIRKIAALTVVEEAALVRRYQDRRGCFRNLGKSEPCYAIERFKDVFARYRRGAMTVPRQAQVLLEIASNLEHFVDFEDLVRIAGGPENLFVTAVTTGFRIGSENLSRPLLSNTFGRPDQVNPSGVVDSAQQILGMGDGEFYMQWLRGRL